MEQKRRLNVDIGGSISEFRSIVKEFRLKKEIYRLIFRGKGLEFESYRNFSPDDDARDIDWKASSRAQKLLVKQYKEERNLKIVFLVDVGSNMVFGSTEKIKCEFVTEFVAAFANLIISSNDRIGFFLFNDNVNHFVECKGGTKHFQLFIDTLSNGFNYGGKSDINKALDFATKYLNKSIHSVIIISDFLNVNNETKKKLSLLSKMFETMAIRVKDPLDITLPDINKEIIIEDSSTNQQLIINPKIAKKTYEKYTLEQGKEVEKMFKESEVDYLDLTTDKSFVIPFATFLKERIERRF